MAYIGKYQEIQMVRASFINNWAKIFYFCFIRFYAQLFPNQLFPIIPRILSNLKIPKIIPT